MNRIELSSLELMTLPGGTSQVYTGLFNSNDKSYRKFFPTTYALLRCLKIHGLLKGKRKTSAASTDLSRGFRGHFYDNPVSEAVLKVITSGTNGIWFNKELNGAFVRAFSHACPEEGVQIISYVADAGDSKALVNTAVARMIEEGVACPSITGKDSWLIKSPQEILAASSSFPINSLFDHEKAVIARSWCELNSPFHTDHDPAINNENPGPPLLMHPSILVEMHV